MKEKKGKINIQSYFYEKNKDTQELVSDIENINLVNEKESINGKENKDQKEEIVNLEDVKENNENISANERREEARKISKMIRREQELKKAKEQNEMEI